VTIATLCSVVRVRRQRALSNADKDGVASAAAVGGGGGGGGGVRGSRRQEIAEFQRKARENAKVRAGVSGAGVLHRLRSRTGTQFANIDQCRCGARGDDSSCALWSMNARARAVQTERIGVSSDNTVERECQDEAGQHQ
jgi:hypothetical protein